MRGFGIVALILIFFSTLFWLIQWISRTFFTAKIGENPNLLIAVQFLGNLGTLCEFLAIILLCIGLIIGAKYLQKSSNQ